MSYFERTKVTNANGIAINPATDDSLTLLRRILLLLKPLGIITGNGSNRLSVDVNNVASITTVSTVSASTTINQTNMGGVTAFDMMKAMSRTAYNQGIRSRLS